MTDRELLERAARAAGIQLEWSGDQSGYYSDWRGLPQWEQWDPLADDGDALRLLVKLRIELRWDFADHVTAAGDGVWEELAFLDNPDAAVRRAVVMAAAEMAP